MIALSSSVRPSVNGGPESHVRAAAEAGCDAVSVGADCLLADVGRIVAAGLQAGLRLGPLWAPLGERRLAPGGRLPRLASAHRDERVAAVRQVELLMEAAADLGGRLFVLDLGQVPLRVMPAEMDLVFRRGELDEAEGQELRAAMMGERRATSRTVLDGCRWSLEAVLRAAERRSAAVALQLASGPWQAPSPVEAEALLQDFRGAALGVLWSPAALDALGALGVRVDPARAVGLARAATALLATEAVGIETGYLPGQGETELGAGLSLAGETSAPIVLGGRSDSSPAELRRAVELVRGWCSAGPTPFGPMPAGTGGATSGSS